LSAGVAEAGPPPATILLFPGTYAESVDLGTMGSAPGTPPGRLAIVSVDAAGLPMPGAVVDPGAPTGPGTGPAITAVGFPGELTLDGLVLRSPDDQALSLVIGTASVHLARLDTRSSTSNGILVLQAPAATTTVTIEQTIADGSPHVGIALGASHVTATDVTARNNGEAGMVLGGNTIVAQRLLAEGNGTVGVLAVPAFGAATFSLTDVTVRDNDSGLEVLPDASATTTTGSLNDVAAAANAGFGVVVLTDSLTANGLTATNNQTGVLLLVRDVLEASSLLANGNAAVGIGASAAELRLEGASANGNLIGVVLEGDHVVLEESSATGNGPAGGGFAAGAGFVIKAGVLEARANAAISNAIGWLMDDTPSTAALLATPRRAPSLKGISPDAQRLTILRAHTEGNSLASMRVSLFPGGRMTVGCSNFVANSPTGLELLTKHDVDARANFWGGAGGPTHPENPGGGGDAISDGSNGGSGNVLFAPFLAAPAQESDCPATASVVEVPALGPVGLALLALIVAGAAILRLRFSAR
jgi:hypothetical protein